MRCLRELVLLASIVGFGLVGCRSLLKDITTKFIPDELSGSLCVRLVGQNKVNEVLLIGLFGLLDLVVEFILDNREKTRSQISVNLFLWFTQSRTVVQLEFLTKSLGSRGHGSARDSWVSLNPTGYSH
jgi:hypothetical protein